MKFLLAVFALSCSVSALPTPPVSAELVGDVVRSAAKSVHFSDSINKVHVFEKAMPVNQRFNPSASLFQELGVKETIALKNELTLANQQLKKIVAKLGTAKLELSHLALLDTVFIKGRKVDTVNPTMKQVFEYKEALKALENAFP